MASLSVMTLPFGFFAFTLIFPPVDTTVAKAEELFKTTYHAYEHSDSGKMSIACDEYHLPSHLTPHVDFIKPGLKPLHGKTSRSTLDKRGFRTKGQSAFSPPVLSPIIPEIINGSTQAMLANCDKYITPPCITTMYNISKPTKAAPGNQVGLPLLPFWAPLFLLFCFFFLFFFFFSSCCLP